ncbi:MAG: hypothetical protein ACJA08_000722 [Cyclobacteriaceae bacterium]|jgi:hypothetical protein
MTMAVSHVFGQRLKYEDDLQRIHTLPLGGQIAELNIWLAKEPTNASIFLQMALVYKERYKLGDPLKDYAYKTGNAKLALFAFERTEQYITEKDVKKNQESYYNFGIYDDRGKFTVPYDSVQNKIARSKAELVVYIKNAPEIYSQFTQSFSHYDKAYKIYSSILGRFPTFKELFLLFNTEVDTEFESLKSEYLLAMEHFEKYKAAIANFDIGYSQNLTIKEINVYRLDGLESQINFLQNKISVWDYAKWVDTTRINITTEIGSLRTSLAAENQKIDTKIKAAIPDYIRDEFTTMSVSKEVLFNLRKYDLNAVVEPIFLYKEKKHDLIFHELQNESLDTSATVDVERKLYLYGQMINKIRVADSTLSDITRRNSDLSYKKYTSFIDTYYQGMAGINAFASTEMKDNGMKVKGAVTKIRDYIYLKYAQDTLSHSVLNKKMEIPLTVTLPVENEFLTTTPITTQIIKTFDGSSVLAGIFKNEKEGKTQAYLCAVTADNKMAWFNEYLLQQDSALGFDSHTRVAAMQFVPGGIAFVLNGVDSSGVNRINHLLVVDETGNMTFSRRLLYNQYPRTLNYSSKNNSLIITFKGDEFSDTILKESELIITSYNILGDLLWQKRMSFKGDVTGLVEVDKAFILTGNYSEMKTLDGRINRAGTKNTDTKIFLMKISGEGEITELKLVDFATSVFTNFTYRVSDDCINLFGSKDAYEKTIALNTDDQQSVHLIVNGDLEILSSNLK